MTHIHEGEETEAGKEPKPAEETQTDSPDQGDADEGEGKPE